jgi:hypothetical protein
MVLIDIDDVHFHIRKSIVFKDLYYDEEEEELMDIPEEYLLETFIPISNEDSIKILECLSYWDIDFPDEFYKYFYPNRFEIIQMLLTQKLYHLLELVAINLFMRDTI